MTKTKPQPTKRMGLYMEGGKYLPDYNTSPPSLVWTEDRKPKSSAQQSSFQRSSSRWRGA